MLSKKRSDAKPPDGTVFFVDRSLGVEPIRSALVAAGVRVEIHDDYFDSISLGASKSPNRSNLASRKAG